jgi:hypothetical protein
MCHVNGDPPGVLPEQDRCRLTGAIRNPGGHDGRGKDEQVDVLLEQAQLLLLIPMPRPAPDCRCRRAIPPAVMGTFSAALT